MKIKSINFIPALIFFVAFFLVSNFSFTQAAGLVPCGGPSEAACNLCDFIVGIQKIVQFGLGLITTVCFAAIFFAGVMYVISAGNEGLMKQAKAFLSSSLIGFAVVMSAWLIVMVIIWALAADPSSGITNGGWATFSCSAGGSVTATSAQPRTANGNPMVSPVMAPAASVTPAPPSQCKIKKLTALDVQCQEGSVDSIALASIATADKPSTYNLKVMANYDCTDNAGKTTQTQEDVTQNATWTATDGTIAKANQGVIQAIGAGITPVITTYSEGGATQTASTDVFVDTCPLDRGVSGGGTVAPPQNSQGSITFDDFQYSPQFENQGRPNFFKSLVANSANAASSSCKACHKKTAASKNCELINGTGKAPFSLIFSMANITDDDTCTKNPLNWENSVTRIKEVKGIIQDHMKYEVDKLPDNLPGLVDVYFFNKVVGPGAATGVDNSCGQGHKYYGFVYWGSNGRAHNRGNISSYCLDELFDNNDNLVVQHEVWGHGIGTLNDEYVEAGKINKAYCSNFKNYNCTASPTCQKWTSTGIINGCVEGCNYAAKGLFRQNENSVMNDHTLGYSFSVLQSVVVDYKIKHYPDGPKKLQETPLVGGYCTP